MGGIHWNTLLNPPKKSWHPFPFWQWQLFGNIWSSIPSLNWTTFDFIWYLWHRLPGQRIAQMARGGILAKQTQICHTNIFMNLKQDLVIDPLSFKRAMSFAHVFISYSWWIFMEATLNVSSSVSPSWEKSKFRSLNFLRSTIYILPDFAAFWQKIYNMIYSSRWLHNDLKWLFLV